MQYQFLALALLPASAIIIFFSLGLYFYFRSRRMVKYWHRTKGLVIDFEPKGSSSAGTLYSPKVSFIARDNRNVQFVEYWASAPPHFRKGEEVVVLYNPTNFCQAFIFDNKWRFYYGAWLCFLLGGIFLLIGGLAAITFGVAAYFLGLPGASE